MSDVSSTLAWPPAFSIRRSNRARRINLHIDPVKGLELVLPRFASEAEGLDFLDRHRSWVTKHQHLLDKKTQREAYPNDLPCEINFHFLEKKWDIRYHQLVSTKITKVTLMGDTIVVRGKAGQEPAYLEALKKWIKQQAKLHLTPYFKALSEAINLPFHQLSFRGQKTLWGSCSQDKDISLNYKLLFLPVELVRYVLIHELCHTQHLNHSKCFWALVKKHEPHYRECIKKMKRADDYVPSWCLS